MYLVLARKYRPQRFEDVRGQEHVIRTLKNALRDKKVAHAYLFAGPRGVGKTTVARILSKAVNCEHGISQEPCNECSICREITEGRSVDVAEIDGASHRGIDEVRGLRENAFYPPARTRYKIYIIDEVHMLTKEAFNALLKILEEPPPYLIFIFATTEPHRIPSTILSRCQRFDFRRLTTDEIFTQLYEIKEKEKIEIDDDALKLIAKRADGSLRDAEGMLDQLNTYCGGKITEKDIKEVFGIMDEKFYLDMLNAILDRDDKKIAERITELSRRGVDWGEVTRGLIDFFEKLLHVRLGIEEDELLKPKAERLNEDQILYMLNQVISLERRLKQVPYTTALV
ncbi:DNA polymerase III subunit gamma/tau, partial [bacterium]